jgi:hypothetical protein
LLRALARSSIPWGIAAGFAAGLMLAEPNQVALLGVYALSGCVLSHWWLSWSRPGALRESLKPIAAGLAVAALIVAVPLILCILYVDVSNRPIIAYGEAVHGSLHPASLLTMLVSDLFGAYDPKVEYWGPFSESWNKNDLTLSQNMGQMYVGTLPVLLVLTVGLVRGLVWSREIRGLTIMTGLLLLYALGSHTPAYSFFYDVMPGVALFRRPADATFLVGGLMAVLGGYLVHRWLTDSLPRLGWRGRYLELGIVIAGLLAAVGIAGASGKLGLAWKPVLSSIGWLTLTLLLLAAPRRWVARAGVALVLAPAVLMTADLAANNGPNESTAIMSASYDVLKPDCRNETIRFLKAKVRRAPGTEWRDRVELVGLGFEWPNAALVHGIDTTLGYNPLRIGLVARALGARDYIAGPDQRYYSTLFPSYHSRLGTLLGLRFIASSIPIEQVDERLERGELKFLARTQDAYIYENVDALPRVMFVQHWEHASFEQIMTDGRWPSFDPAQTVLLDGEPEIAGMPNPTGTVEDSPSIVRLSHYENTVVEVEVDAADDGFVLLNDVWHPWWAAEVDGHAVPIYRANVLFRAVRVAKGSHLIRFEFRPFAGAIAELGEKLLGSEK